MAMIPMAARIPAARAARAAAPGKKYMSLNVVMPPRSISAQASSVPSWTNCSSLHDLSRKVRSAADVVGTSSTDNASLGTHDSPRIVYIDGDYTVGSSVNGGGLLWVTGILTFHGNASWAGSIFTVGKGRFERTGGGNGLISGASFVANIAGPDGVMWTADDCAGADGVVGTLDDGAAVATYNNSGGGTGDTVYCSKDISSVQDEFPFRIAGFRQR